MFSTINRKKAAVGAALMAAAVAVGLSAGAGVTGAAGQTYTGNVTTCAQLGYGSSLDSGYLEQVDGDYSTGLISYTISGGDKYVTITSVDPTVLINAIVVKGGNSYTVFTVAEPDMHAAPNQNSVIPRISHWFICYELVPATTTTAAPTTSTTTTVPVTTVPETTVPETTVPVTTVPETTVPVTTVPETTVAPTTVAPTTTLPATTTTNNAVLPPFNPRLPDTGSDMNGLLVVALLLTGFGTLVHAVVRRTA